MGKIYFRLSKNLFSFVPIMRVFLLVIMMIMSLGKSFGKHQNISLHALAQETASKRLHLFDAKAQIKETDNSYNLNQICFDEEDESELYELSELESNDINSNFIVFYSTEDLHFILSQLDLASSGRIQYPKLATAVEPLQASILLFKSEFRI